jgi:hypothetical protein
MAIFNVEDELWDSLENLRITVSELPDALETVRCFVRGQGDVYNWKSKLKSNIDPENNRKITKSEAKELAASALAELIFVGQQAKTILRLQNEGHSFRQIKPNPVLDSLARDGKSGNLVDFCKAVQKALENFPN